MIFPGATGWAIVYRALLPVMQRSRNPLVRALVKRHGVAPTGADGRMTWQDRLLAAFVAAVCAGVLFGIAALGITLSDRWPLSSTPSVVVMGIGFVCMILGDDVVGDGARASRPRPVRPVEERAATRACLVRGRVAVLTTGRFVRTFVRTLSRSLR
ncbi:MAG TPA: hypothetical protein VFE05_18825 [Longimicrobiaceae bacterium]|jgi:hypothetical protein|nr:hypothetical protein [Longimicrobiaceae bacterium]